MWRGCRLTFTVTDQSNQKSEQGLFKKFKPPAASPAYHPGMALPTDLITSIAGQVRAAAAAGTALRLRGGGSKDFYGESLQGDILDTAPLNGVISYEPSELVVTALAGTPLAELEALLLAQGQ